jgi:hypothetical protein
MYLTNKMNNFISHYQFPSLKCALDGLCYHLTVACSSGLDKDYPQLHNIKICRFKTDSASNYSTLME